MNTGAHRLLVDALMRGYRFLSAFVRDQKELARISQEDMNVLGRRLFAAFERKAGKVELIRAGNVRNLHEPHLAIRRQVRKGQESWLLFRGAILGVVSGPDEKRPPSLDRASGTRLKRSRTLLELIVWCHFNGIANSTPAFPFPSRAPVPPPLRSAPSFALWKSSSPVRRSMNRPSIP